MLYYQRGIVNTSFVAGVCLFEDFCTALTVLLYIFGQAKTQTAFYSMYVMKLIEVCNCVTPVGQHLKNSALHLVVCTGA